MNQALRRLNTTLRRRPTTTVMALAAVISGDKGLLYRPVAGGGEHRSDFLNVDF